MWRWCCWGQAAFILCYFLCLAIVFTGHTVGDVENDLVVEKVLVFQERMDNVSWDIFL